MARPARPEVTGRGPHAPEQATAVPCDGQGFFPGYGLSPIQLNKIVSLNEAVELSSLSRDVWLRRYKHLIIRLSDQRLGVRMGHALFITHGA
jgi:hypothetical protein